MLNDLQLAMLWQRLQTPPPDGGLWNSRKVAEWMSELLERRVSKQRRKLEVSVVVVIWFCSSPVRRNLFLDFTLCQ